MWLLGKDIFGLVTSVGQKKYSESPQGIEPQSIDALPLSHRLYGERGLLRSS